MESTLTKATESLHISDNASAALQTDSEQNPWESSDKPSASDPKPEKPVAFSEDDLLPSERPEFSPPEHSKPPSDDGSDPQERKQQILDEFDPLANQEEKAAKEAWEASESHPAPPPPPPSKDPTPNTTNTTAEGPQTPQRANTQPEPARPSSPIPSFPSLAALARTFSIPLGPRTRPRSLDTAAAVPSPATLSSFASQQQIPPKPETPPGSTSGNVGPSTPTRSSSRNSRTQSGDKDGESSAFDFQRFLDQMKQKNAEPVAKYLRSYVSVLFIASMLR